MSGEIDVGLLRTLLRYEPDTGRLFWLERDVSLFEATATRSAAHSCAWWNARFAGAEAFTAPGPHGCRHGKIFGRLHYAHRVAWALQHGAWPENEIDHESGDRGDNRLGNLRDVTHQVNMQNKRRYRSNTSGTPGVAFNRRMGRWQSFITVNGKRRHLGTFDRAEDAARARLQAQAASGAFHENHGRAA